MIAAGPFCMACSRPLQVQPCSCQWVDHISNDALCLGALRLALGMPVHTDDMIIYPCAWRGSMSIAGTWMIAQNLGVTYQEGVIVVHAVRAYCYWFAPNGAVSIVSMRDALVAVQSRRRILVLISKHAREMMHLHFACLW